MSSMTAEQPIRIQFPNTTRAKTFDQPARDDARWQVVERFGGLARVEMVDENSVKWGGYRFQGERHE